MTLDTVQFEPPQVGATPTDAYNYVEQLADSAYVDTIKAELDQVSDWIPASEPIDTSIISPGFYESNNNQSSGLG
jgi:hypothetical protein